MKKMSLILFVLVTVSCAVVLGGTHPRLAVVKTGDIFKVIYKDQSTCSVRLSILDADGQEVFTEKVASQGGFVRPYNFSELPKGNYTLRVVDPTGEYIEKISWEEPQWFAHVAKVKGKEKKYMVVIPHQFNQGVVINVYNHNQELVFSELKNPTDDFARIYNLKNVAGGTIQLVNQSSGEEKVFTTE